MRLKKIVLITVSVLFVGGFLYIATTDIKTQQQEVTQTIPNDRFYKDE